MSVQYQKDKIDSSFSVILSNKNNNLKTKNVEKIIPKK